MTDGGKGDIPRPLGVPREEFEKNFELIFGKKEPVPFIGWIDKEDDKDQVNV